MEPVGRGFPNSEIQSPRYMLEGHFPVQGQLEGDVEEQA